MRAELRGEKIADLKNMTVEEMLATLIESKVVNDYRDRHIHELVGDFNYLGTVQQHTESQQNEWTPPDPSMAQLRASITEYCVLPLGSTALKAKLSDVHNVKSILLYGPSGAGKTMMAEAVANELGALLINMSPVRLKGHFGGKNDGVIHFPLQAVEFDLGTAHVATGSFELANLSLACSSCLAKPLDGWRVEIGSISSPAVGVVTAADAATPDFAVTMRLTNLHHTASSARASLWLGS